MKGAIQKTWNNALEGPIAVIVVSAVAGPFIFGGLALAAPLVPPLREWLQTITLYDLFVTVGFWYAIVMSVVGMQIGFLPKPNGKPREALEWMFGGAGLVIFLLLVAGRFLI